MEETKMRDILIKLIGGRRSAFPAKTDLEVRSQIPERTTIETALALVEKDFPDIDIKKHDAKILSQHPLFMQFPELYTEFVAARDEIYMAERLGLSEQANLKKANLKFRTTEIVAGKFSQTVQEVFISPATNAQYPFNNEELSKNFYEHSDKLFEGIYTAPEDTVFLNPTKVDFKKEYPNEIQSMAFDFTLYARLPLKKAGDDGIDIPMRALELSALTEYMFPDTTFDVMVKWASFRSSYKGVYSHYSPSQSNFNRIELFTELSNAIINFLTTGQAQQSTEEIIKKRNKGEPYERDYSEIIKEITKGVICTEITLPSDVQKKLDLTLSPSYVEALSLPLPCPILIANIGNRHLQLYQWTNIR